MHRQHEILKIPSKARKILSIEIFWLKPQKNDSIPSRMLVKKLSLIRQPQRSKAEVKCLENETKVIAVKSLYYICIQH